MYPLVGDGDGFLLRGAPLGNREWCCVAGMELAKLKGDGERSVPAPPVEGVIALGDASAVLLPSILPSPDAESLVRPSLLARDSWFPWCFITSFREDEMSDVLKVVVSLSRSISSSPDCGSVMLSTSISSPPTSGSAAGPSLLGSKFWVSWCSIETFWKDEMSEVLDVVLPFSSLLSRSVSISIAKYPSSFWNLVSILPIPEPSSSWEDGERDILEGVEWWESKGKEMLVLKRWRILQG